MILGFGLGTGSGISITIGGIGGEQFSVRPWSKIDEYCSLEMHSHVSSGFRIPSMHPFLH